MCQRSYPTTHIDHDSIIPHRLEFFGPQELRRLRPSGERVHDDVTLPQERVQAFRVASLVVRVGVRALLVARAAEDVTAYCLRRAFASARNKSGTERFGNPTSL